MTRSTAKLFLCVVALGLYSVALPAYADLVSTIQISNSYGDTNGGEFLANPANFSFMPFSLGSGQSGEFETFCVEVNEHISYGTTYFVDISDHAVHGGAGGGDPDPLDRLTAYLYTQFITGQLANYAYSVGDGGVARAASADALQHVFWYIEEEEGLSWTPGDGSLRDVFYRDATDHAGSGIGGVRILNLFEHADSTGFAQDQLVRTPEPSSLLALLSCGAVVLVRRRRP